MRPFALSILVFALLVTSPTAAAPRIKQVWVVGPRVTLATVLAGRTDLQSVDLGVAPAPGGSRVVTRDDMLRALRAQQDEGAPEVAPKDLPRAVRLIRKMTTLTPASLEQITRTALAKTLPSGFKVTSVRAPRSVKVAEGWGGVTVSLPKPPRREGTWSTTAMLNLGGGNAPVARVAVPVQLTISTAAAKPDVARGAALMLVVQRGTVEVRVRGFAGADADLGEVFPVQLRPSGRVVRAKLVTPKKAVAVDSER